MPLTVNEIVHSIQLVLMSPCINPDSRLAIISFVKAGFDENGKRIIYTEEMDMQIKTFECIECSKKDEHGNCNEECQVKAYHDLQEQGHKHE